MELEKKILTIKFLYVGLGDLPHLFLLKFFQRSLGNNRMWSKHNLNNTTQDHTKFGIRIKRQDR